jgi:ATP-dependent protease ClpP protease subunit
LRAQSGDGGTLLRLYGPIGEGGITASSFHDELSAIRGNVTLRVHSPGGDPLAAIAMYNDLLAHPGRVKAEVAGVAASAASILIMAADEIAVAENAHVMVHHVYSLAIGDARAHRAEAEALESIDASLVQTYARRTGLSSNNIRAMLDKETWMRGAEAVRLGFADKILESADVTARANFDLSVYANVPASLASAELPSLQASSEISSRQHLEKILRDALPGLSRGAARKIAVGGFSALAGTPQNEFDVLAESVAAAAVELRNAI